MRSKKRGGSSSNNPPSYNNTMRFTATQGQTNRRITATPSGNVVRARRPVRGPRTPSPPPPPPPGDINLIALWERLEAANIETDEAVKLLDDINYQIYYPVDPEALVRSVDELIARNAQPASTSSQPRRTRQLPTTPSGIVTSTPRQPRRRTRQRPPTHSGNVTSTPRQPRGRKKLPNRSNKGINISRNITQNRSRRNRPIIQSMRNRTVRRAPSSKPIMREKSKKNIVNRRKNSN
jgi:hypothetical protein